MATDSKLTGMVISRVESRDAGTLREILREEEG